MDTNRHEWEGPAGWFCWAKRGEPQMDTDGHGWDGACRLALLGVTRRSRRFAQILLEGLPAGFALRRTTNGHQ